jgi:hypothetical protein
MNRLSGLNRRAFLGLATAGIAGAAAAATKLVRSGQERPVASASRPAAHRPRHAAPVPENELPGDPNWQITDLGAQQAIEGYAGQASVLTVPGHTQPGPSLVSPTNTVQTAWEPSLTVPTDDWPAGSYLLRLDADAGAQRYVPVTVRSASTAGKVVIKNGVATWQAYNLWGGYDLYNGPGGVDDYGNRSLAVSLDKPFDKNGAPLFGVYELNAVQLAESLGLPLAYVTSMDIATDPHLLDGASALISLGHDEYWSPAERANVTAARDAGVNALPRPESSLTGTLYESNPTTAAYVVATPDSWIFAGTGVATGTSFPGLVGDEYDRVNPGAPVERPIQVLAHSPLTCRGINSYSDSAYYTHSGGAGVFNSGTMRWVQAIAGGHEYGITPAANQFVKKATSNILRAFADGPAAAEYPAQDNLDAMDEYAGDPIAAQHNLW